MTPELALVVIVVLLWGPTTLWLAYRSIRNSQRDTFHSTTGQGSLDLSPRSRPGDVALVQLVDEEAFWVCEGCKSINRPTSRRCYGCHLQRGATPDMAGDAAAAAMMVPVMARPATMPGTRAVPVPMASMSAMAVGAVPASVLEASTAIAEAGPASPAPATPSDRPPRPVANAPARAVEPPIRRVAPPAAVVAQAAPEQVPEPVAPVAPGRVCPHLRLDNDPYTWFDFPHAANLCHARVNETGGRRGLVRLLPARIEAGRPQVTSPEVQQSLCLTESHTQCARYRGARSGVGLDATVAASTAPDARAADPTPAAGAATVLTPPSAPRPAEAAQPVARGVPASQEPAPPDRAPGSPTRRRRRLAEPAEGPSAGPPGDAGPARSRTKPAARAADGSGPSTTGSQDVVDAR